MVILLSNSALDSATVAATPPEPGPATSSPNEDEEPTLDVKHRPRRECKYPVEKKQLVESAVDEKQTDDDTRPIFCLLLI